MKRRLFALLVVGLLVASVVGVTRIVSLDRETWIVSRRFAIALKGARAVTLTEYVPGKIIARKAATPDEMVRLRSAASTWWRPFRPDASVCWEPHHSVDIVRADGSAVTVEICFLCGKFGFLSDDESVVPIPPSVNQSLSVFFTSIGMKPRNYEDYLAMEATPLHNEKAEK